MINALDQFSIPTSAPSSPSGHLLPGGEGLATYFFANLDTDFLRQPKHVGNHLLTTSTRLIKLRPLING